MSPKPLSSQAGEFMPGGGGSGNAAANPTPSGPPAKPGTRAGSSASGLRILGFRPSGRTLLVFFWYGIRDH